MKVETSDGEVFDKLTILKIKLLNFTDPIKIQNVKNESVALSPIYTLTGYENNTELRDLVDSLYKINSELWDIEDKIRVLEKQQNFGEEFIQLARSVYFTNDKRAEIKKRINILTKSALVEEKGYAKYV